MKTKNFKVIAKKELKNIIGSAKVYDILFQMCMSGNANACGML